MAETVTPRHDREAAWRSLCAGMPDGRRAAMTSARLAFVPFGVSSRGGRAVWAPLADLSPSGIPMHVRLAGRARDESGPGEAEAEALVRAGERIDVMIPAGSSEIVYHPFWLFTYRIDYKDHAGAVDAVWGKPAGPASPPRRWAPAAGAAGAGLILFAGVAIPTVVFLAPPAGWILAGLASWAAAFVVLGRGMLRERGR